MREPIRDKERLQHISAAIDRILRYTSEKTYDDIVADWKMVKGMRNYIVHEYFQVDDIVVWDVVKNNIPELREQINRYLSDTNWEEWEQANGEK